MGFNLDNYETVEERLVKFWEAHPEGRILTSIHHYDDNKVVIKAEIYFNREDERPVATGYAEEVRGSSPVNKTAHVENADTSAIGRGLANCGFQSKAAPRPSRQEMEKVNRYNERPVERPMPAKPAQNFSKQDQTSVADAVDEVIKQFGGEVVSTAPSIKNPDEPASPKQLGMIRAVLRGMEVTTQSDVIDLCGATVGRMIEKLDELTKGEASMLISKFKEQQN
jgi:hypothetical protein